MEGNGPVLSCAAQRPDDHNRLGKWQYITETMIRAPLENQVIIVNKKRQEVVENPDRLLPKVIWLEERKIEELLFLEQGVNFFLFAAAPFKLLPLESYCSVLYHLLVPTLIYKMILTQMTNSFAYSFFY